MVPRHDGFEHRLRRRPLLVPIGNQAGPVRTPRVLGGSRLGSCRIGVGFSSQTAAWRLPSSSRRSGASRARRRTPEWPPQTPRSSYRPLRTAGPLRRRIRRVGPHCVNLVPPSVSGRSLAIEHQIVNPVSRIAFQRCHYLCIHIHGYRYVRMAKDLHCNTR